jgi:protein-S-isoprenylcysteine O-methyltransferase Ste14
MQPHSLVRIIITGCWVVFVATWAVAAVSTKRTVYRETQAQRLRYWVLLVIAFFLLFYGRLPYPLNSRVVPNVAPVIWAAGVLSVIGVAVALWARFTLGRNWSGVVTLKEEHELVERGPYRFVRHPIYTGILTMYFATAIGLGHLAGFVGTLLIFLSFWIKLRDEEQLMLQQFPERYAAYRQRAKRIIPFIL